MEERSNIGFGDESGGTALYQLLSGPEIPMDITVA